jgi:hypothetical protein
MHHTATRRVLRSLGLAIALTLGLAVCGAAFVGIARADAPDPRNCIAPDVLVSAPSGGFTYAVTLRDAANQPTPGATAVLDFNPAPGILLCEEHDPDHDRRVLGTAGPTGVVNFSVRAGGHGSGTLEVLAMGIVIATASVRTMDFDGDLDVDANDRNALAALVGTSGPAGDFDHNGSVDAADQAMLEQRLGGNCTLLPARPATWGMVKGLYR